MGSADYQWVFASLRGAAAGRMTTVFINGKFTAQATTGVQRSAAYTVDALDRLLASPAAPPGRWVLLCPLAGRPPALKHIEVRQVGGAGRSLHLWEQAVLPWAARGAMLLNLAGSAPFFKRRQVCTFHDAAVFDCPEAHTWAFRLWYRLLFRRVARSARVLLTVSEFSKRQLMRHLDLPDTAIAVASGGGEHMLPVHADPAVLARAGSAGAGFFVAVGSANPVKNHAALIRAFEALPPGFEPRLVLVGDANPAVFKRGEAAATSARIVRVGRVPDTELKALYGAALGLIFPSLYEGFGLPLLEAMACGCPVAASNAASIPEVCGDAAIYFDPHSQAAMSAAIVQLAGDSALRERLRALGAVRARQFSWDHAARVVLSRLVPR